MSPTTSIQAPAEREIRAPALVFALVGALATIVLWGVHISLRDTHAPGDPWRLVVTGLLVAAFGLWVSGHVQLSRAMDEFHRQVQLMALSIAFPISLVAGFGISFFAAEGVLRGIEPRDLPGVMLFAYMLGLLIAWWRYR